MIRKSIVIAAIFGTTAYWACQKPAFVNASQSLPLHGCMQPAEPGQVKLCLDSVLEDSRCPANMECFWQGEALAKFTFHVSSRVYSFKLIAGYANGFYPADTTIEGYHIRFIDLFPHAGAHDGSSRAVVSITR